VAPVEKLREEGKRYKGKTFGSCDRKGIERYPGVMETAKTADGDFEASGAVQKKKRGEWK